MTQPRLSRKTRGSESSAGGVPRPWGELLGIALLAVGALMGGGLLSYQTGDGSLMGPVGRLAAGALYASFGMAAYLVTLGVLAVGFKALLGQRMEIRLGEGLGFSVATVAGCVLLHVVFPTYRVHGYTAGGLAGELLGEVSLGLFHHAGTYLVALALLCAGLIASTPLDASHLVAGARLLARGLRAVGVYLWDGLVGLAHAQRESEEDRRVAAGGRRHSSDEMTSVAGEDESAEDGELGDGTEDEEDEHEPDEEADVEEDEEEIDDEEEASDEADDEEEDDGEDDEEGEDEDSERAANGGTKKRGVRPKAANDCKPEGRKARTGKGGELPEIVVQHEEAAGDRPAGKKPPPRPEELARIPVAAAVAARPDPRRENHLPGVVRLTDGPFELPPIKLFEAAEKEKAEVDRKFVLEQAERLVGALNEFKIKGKVTTIHPGPVITRYEFKPEPGVKLSKIESLENDIAMALEAVRIRILAPIPGKSTVGFEVPNKVRETVYIKEILAHESFGHGMKLPMALGKDIVGKPRWIDLAKAPHLLVAGATGSGKSVGVNAMISSLLYTSSPEDVRMIMIDPKMLELSIYEGVPHLLLPVVTDAEKANLALRWAVEEMERRYELLSAAQVRDIAGYNRKLPELLQEWHADRRVAEDVALAASKVAAEEGEDSVSGTKLAGFRVDEEGNQVPVVADLELPDKPNRLPYVVVIIDEFADLMMVASKEVEQNVARIAAKARAAGIHLIVATQRPSVDVITGTIKNNFPSRIAFQVTSDADSRTILDGKGAKQLLGMGDMLYMDRGSEVQRVHGCFVSEDEILKVVKFVKKQAKPVYNMEIVRKRDENGLPAENEESMDPLYDRAVQIVAESQKVSTSMLQRRLNIGYNRAAKIVERMEEQGVIGPARGTSPREVFVSAA